MIRAKKLWIYIALIVVTIITINMVYPKAPENNDHVKIGNYIQVICQIWNVPVLGPISLIMLLALPIVIGYYLLAYGTMQITVDKDSFTYKNVFKEVSCRYDEIQKVTLTYNYSKYGTVAGKFLHFIPKNETQKKISIPLHLISDADSQLLTSMFKDKIVTE